VIRSGLCFLLSLLFSLAALAQPYPSKPIRIIVPFPVGGIADIYSRLIGNRWSELWGQPVLVENRTGAGGNIAAEMVAKASPDGYTLVMGSIGTHAVNVTLFSKLPYDPVRDFAPVALAVDAEGLLALHPSVPAHNVQELIALARSKPGALAYASAGAGTASHLAGELFKSMAKVDLVHVPYKGNVPALTDLLAGQTSSSSPPCRPRCRTRSRQAARPGEHRRHARRRHARAADGGGNDARLRGQQLGGSVRARRYAGRNRRAAEHRDAQFHAVEGDRRAPCRRRGALHADDARAVRRLREGRDREVGAGSEGIRRESGMMSPIGDIIQR
jgi:hypothetical protein